MVRKIIDKSRDYIVRKKKSIFWFFFFLILVVFAYSFFNNIFGSFEAGGIEGVSDGNVVLPIFGEIDIKESSLFLVSVFIGLLDGFNPCAMWVLIYLITLVARLDDRRKMWFIVGTFLIASGVLYFAILAGWLNLFMMIGFSKWVLFFVGAFALWMGGSSICSFVRERGHIVCEVGDLKSRKRTVDKIREIVHSPITIFSFFAVIALAFAVNSIEFVCSAGLPAMFAQVLAVSDVGVLMKYFYMLVYTLAFMADDLIIFSLAVFAIDSAIVHKYCGLSKLIGGILMIGIGIVLIFFPGLLM